MTKREFKKLWPGIYRVWWKGGGTSVAAIGKLHNGDAWIAPANWTGLHEGQVMKGGTHRMIKVAHRVLLEDMSAGDTP